MSESYKIIQRSLHVTGFFYLFFIFFGQEQSRYILCGDPWYNSTTFITTSNSTYFDFTNLENKDNKREIPDYKI